MPRATANSSGKSSPKKKNTKTASKAVKKTASRATAKKRTTRQSTSSRSTTKRKGKKSTASVKAKTTPKKTTSKRKQTATKKVGVKQKASVKRRSSVSATRQSKSGANTKNVALEQLFKKTASAEVGTTVSSRNFTIKLPQRVSLAAIEKSKLIRSLSSIESERFARLVAFYGAFALIAFGASYSVSQSSIIPSAILNSANVLSSETPIDTTVITQPIEPSFSVESAPPEVLTGEHKVSFRVSNTAVQRVSLRNVDTREDVSIEPSSTASDLYSVTLAATDVPPGLYQLRVETFAQDLQRRDVFVIGEFSVVAEADTVPVVEENVEDVPVEVTTQTAVSPDVTEDETDATSSAADAAETVEEANGVGKVAVEATEATPNQFTFALSRTQFTKSTVVITTVPKDIEALEIYLTPIGSPTKRFLTAGEFTFNNWRFYVDISNIPSGRYELSAVGLRDGIRMEGRPVIVTIDKSLADVDTSASTNTDAANSNEETVMSDSENSEPTAANPVRTERKFSELSLTPDRTAAPTEASQIVTELLRNRKANLEILLRNYSAAQQGGDETAIALAAEAIDKERRSILDETGRATASVESELTNRLTNLQNKIETFETLRRNADTDGEFVDTDADGISDLDERLLFNTDPNAADTDDDGVPDAVEILRGFNPNAATQEAVIVHESPRETVGLVRADTLQITSVTPEVVQAPDQESSVRSVITGVALPNTYVTLYIFSTPAIVTVRTNEEGEFTYVFEKELSDGEHEVYVAITDNRGDIVAQSEPFRFVKEAEAFTAGAASVTPAPVSAANTTNYGVAIGMGILALGIILLMIGFGLRKEPMAVVESVT